MDRTERFYKIDQLLKDSKIVPFARLAEILGVSRATVKRDLEYMRERFNAPINTSAPRTATASANPAPAPATGSPAYWFNATEIYTLLTTLQLLGNLQPGELGTQTDRLIERLRAILGSGDRLGRKSRSASASSNPSAARETPPGSVSLLQRSSNARDSSSATTTGAMTASPNARSPRSASSTTATTGTWSSGERQW